MNRRKFFKRFGQGVAAAVVAPTVLTSLPEERVITKDEFDVNYTDYKEEPVQGHKGILAMIEERGNIYQYDEFNEQRLIEAFNRLAGQTEEERQYIIYKQG